MPQQISQFLSSNMKNESILYYVKPQNSYKKTKKFRDFTKFSLFQNLALIFTCLPFAVCTKILRVEKIRIFSIEYRTENDHGDENRHTIPQLVHFLAMVIANSALKSYTESADSSKSRASNQCHLCIHRWPQTCTAN